MNRKLIVLASLLTWSCGQGNVCERKLVYEEEECFPELEQPTDVEKDECVDELKADAQCAVRNKDDYCLYYLWLNRGAARGAGYTVSDTLAPNNDYIACIDDAGLRQR